MFITVDLQKYFVYIAASVCVRSDFVSNDDTLEVCQMCTNSPYDTAPLSFDFFHSEDGGRRFSETETHVYRTMSGRKHRENFQSPVVSLQCIKCSYQLRHLCHISGSRSGAAENSSLTGCDAVWSGA